MVAVLVTRPDISAKRFASTLGEYGYQVWLEPLLTIKPINNPCPSFIGKPIVVITSKSSLYALRGREDDVEDFFSCRCYCVGDQTAELAKSIGFDDVLSAASDGKGLAQLLLGLERIKHPILHICGEERMSDPADSLIRAGWDVYPWVVYRAQETDRFSEELVQGLQSGMIDIVTLFSQRAAQVFAKLIKLNNLEPCCASLSAVGLSLSIIQELANLPFGQTLVSKHPNELDMVELLREKFPV